MKVHPRRFNPAPATFAALAAAIALVATGCIVTSVYPFYTEKDLVFEPSLLGDWTADNEADEQKPTELTRVERHGEKGYRVIAFTDNQTNSIICHLFRLKGQLFLDTCPTNHALDLIPVHQVSKVTQLQPVLESANLRYEWLQELLEKQPKAIRHTVVRDRKDEKDETRIVLTADTAELQKFILKHLNNTNAWQAPGRVKRRG